jgi:hypothetical protein
VRPVAEEDLLRHALALLGEQVPLLLVRVLELPVRRLLPLLGAVRRRLAGYAHIERDVKPERVAPRQGPLRLVSLRTFRCRVSFWAWLLPNAAYCRGGEYGFARVYSAYAIPSDGGEYASFTRGGECMAAPYAAAPAYGCGMCACCGSSCSGEDTGPSYA